MKGNIPGPRSVFLFFFLCAALSGACDRIGCFFLSFHYFTTSSSSPIRRRKTGTCPPPPPHLIDVKGPSSLIMTLSLEDPPPLSNELLIATFAESGPEGFDFFSPRPESITSLVGDESLLLLLFLLVLVVVLITRINDGSLSPYQEDQEDVIEGSPWHIT